MTENILTPNEAKKLILADKEIPRGAIIDGDLVLVEQNFTEDTIIKLDEVIVNGSLDISKTAIKALILRKTHIKGMFLCRETLIQDFLDIRNTKIDEHINLTFRKNPKEIYVSKELAEIIHLSAPTTPLVIV